MGPAATTPPPEGAFAQSAFVGGFLEGYNTMDALAGLAFGIVVVQVIRGLGVTEPRRGGRQHGGGRLPGAAG